MSANEHSSVTVYHRRCKLLRCFNRQLVQPGCGLPGQAVRDWCSQMCAGGPAADEAFRAARTNVSQGMKGTHCREINHRAG